MRSRTMHAEPSVPHTVPDIQVRERRFHPTKLQQDFMEDVFSGKWNIFGLGGAIRGGKTISLIQTFFVLCRVYPGSRWAIVRKDLPRIRRNTIPTIEKFAPRPFIGRLDKQEWKYTCDNGSEILLIGEQLQTDPDLDRFKGLEVNGFGLEEANEVSEQTANKCKERAGSWIIQPRQGNASPIQPPALLLCTFNPADNWVRDWFYDPWREGRLAAPYYFKPALPTDNPYNTPEQWAMWRTLPPEQYKRFIEGDWSAIVDPYQLITYQHIIEAANVDPLPGRWRFGVDVASGGDASTGKHDDTVFAPINGNIIDGDWIERQNGWDEPTTTVRIRDYLHGKVHGIGPILPDDVRVDSVGVGSGVFNTLRRWGYNVKAFVAGAKAVPRLVQPVGGAIRNASTGTMRAQPYPVLSAFTFANLRAQAWYEFADQVKSGQWRIVNPTKELIRDLTALRYSITDRQIKVTSTDDVKELTGHSPDVGTAVVMGVFEWPKPARIKAAPTMGAFTG